MQEQPIGVERNHGSNHAEDTEAEAAVLRQLFSFDHPVTLEELLTRRDARRAAHGGET